ncbi:MAG: hypothetical protein LBS01_04290 [Prevotellaceae bacterium]|jgi:hypothetical protein|nr:hypothetical protein [Prevotellaceae bacterium]
MRQFYLIFNNFAGFTVERLDLSYQILMGEGRKLLADENLIETAQWLETQGLVCCIQEEKVLIQLNLDGIDVWIQRELDKLCVKWIAYKPCVYGIELKNKLPQIVVEKEQTLFLPSYKSLWIQTGSRPRTYGGHDIIVLFADIFCAKLNFRQLIESVSKGQDTAFVLKWENDGLYLNEHQILTEQATVQKGIMQILIDQQSGGQCIPFEEIANILQQQYDLEINDIHNQIYRPINVLRTKVMEKVLPLAQRNDFIEICNSSCRLNALIWVED